MTRKMPWFVFIVLSLVLVGTCAAADSPSGTVKVFAKVPLATVTTGLGDTGEVGRVLSVVVSGPMVTTNNQDGATRWCANRALKSSAAELQAKLDDLGRTIAPTDEEWRETFAHQFEQAKRELKRGATIDQIRSVVEARLSTVQYSLALGHPMTNEEVSQAHDLNFKTLNEMFHNAAVVVNEKLIHCKVQGSLKFGVLISSCSQASEECGKSSATLYSSPIARRFSITYPWLNALDPQHKLFAEFPTNAFVNLGTSASQPGVTLEVGPNNREGIYDFNRQLTQEQQQREFERLAKKLRQQGSGQVAPVVPRLLGLPPEVALRLIDVIGDAPTAIPGLTPKPGAKLLELQDEIARTRLIECARFNGKETLAEIEACAPYTLSEQDLVNCLNGRQCMPTLTTKGLFPSSLLAKPLSVKQLINGQPLPRLSFEEQSIPTLPKVFGDPWAKQRGVLLQSLAEACKTDPANCKVTNAFGTALNQAACFKKTTNSFGQVADQIDGEVGCAFGKANSEDIKNALQVTKCFGDKHKSIAQCAAEAAGAPPNVTKAVECQKQATTKEQTLNCAAQALGGAKVADVARLELPRLSGRRRACG